MCLLFLLYNLIKGDEKMQERPKGGKNKYYSKEEEDITAKRQFSTPIKAKYISQWHLMMHIKIIT